MALRQPASTTDLRGILVPEYKLRGAAMSATSSAGPRSGAAAPAQPTAMVLDPSGVLDSTATEDLMLVTERAGGVGTATVRWSYVGEDLRSWDPPTLVSGWEFISRAPTVNLYTQAHAVRRPTTGQLLVVVSADLQTPMVWRQTTAGKWLGELIEVTDGYTTACLVEIPAERRTVCLYTVAVGSETQVRQAYSDDGGVTWVIGSRTCLPEALAVGSNKVLRLRAELLHGLISLVIWEQDSTDILRQYVSETSGANFSVVERITSGTEGCPDMAVRDGVIYLATVNSNTKKPTVRRVSSAGQPFSSVEGIEAADGSGWEWGSVTAGKLTAECALLADDDGVLYLYGQDYDTAGGGTNETGCVVSLDGGDTWGPMHASPSVSQPEGVCVHWSGALTHMKDIAVAPERGRAVMLHRFAGNTPGTYDDSICAAYLGGWSTVGMPEDERYPRRLGMGGWEVLYLPFVLPDADGWTLATTGATTATLAVTGVDITVEALATRYYHRTYTSTAPVDDGTCAEFELQWVSGSTVQEVRISDGTDSYSVRVTVASNLATLRDLNAGLDIGSLPVDTSMPVVIRIATDKPTGAWTGKNGRVRAWARSVAPVLTYGPTPDREWTQIATTSLLHSTPGTTSRVRWGLGEAGRAIYRQVSYSAGSYTARNIADSETGKARGRTLTSATSPIHLVEGRRIHGSKGPSQSLDTWSLPVAYEYPVEHIDPSRHPSPRSRHRATDASGVDYRWAGLDLGWRARDLFAVYIRDATWRTATLYRDVGATLPVMSMDLASGLTGLRFVRLRGMLHPQNTAGTSAPFHFHEGMLAGAVADFGSGRLRRIRWNTAGGWLGGTDPASYASARIELESYDALDPSNGAMTIIMPSGLFISESMESTNDLLLRVGAQATATGYIGTGKVVMGRMRILAHDYGLGRAVTSSPSYAMTQTRGGTRRGRRLAPGRRGIEVAWDEGVDTSGIYTPGSAAPHLTIGYPGADAQAAYADTPRTLMGIFEAMDGAVLPGVLATRIPQAAAAFGTAAPITILNPEEAHFGRFLTETLRMDNVLGDEGRDPGEIFRLPTIRFERET